MRILIIRAEPAATQTAGKIQRLGHDAVLFPMSKCVCKDAYNIDDITNSGGLVVTSANALRCIASKLETQTAIKQEPLFAVGETTAKLGKDLGFKNIIASSGGGAKLGAQMVDYFASANRVVENNKPLSYITTKDRTPDLEEILTENKINFDLYFVYEMVSDYDQDTLNELIQSGSIDVILFYSKNSVRRFFANLSPLPDKIFTSIRFGCLSKEIASVVPIKFHGQIDISVKPDENHLLACIGL